MTRWTQADVDRLKEKRGKPNKMRNQPTEVNGERFPSKKEAAEWVRLSAMQTAGEISGLRRQYPIAAIINGEHICTLIVDFCYVNIHSGGRLRYVDVKGRRAGVQYQLFRLKSKLVRALYGITVEEV